jgi:hypothetical protein
MLCGARQLTSPWARELVLGQLLAAIEVVSSASAIYIEQGQASALIDLLRLRATLCLTVRAHRAGSFLLSDPKRAG